MRRRTVIYSEYHDFSFLLLWSKSAITAMRKDSGKVSERRCDTAPVIVMRWRKRTVKMSAAAAPPRVSSRLRSKGLLFIAPPSSTSAAVKSVPPRRC